MTKRGICIRAVLAVLFVAAYTSMSTANASCGLDYCPIRLKDENTGPRFQVRFVPRFSGFTNNNIQGTFVENIVRIELLAINRWRFGGWVAPIVLHVDNNRTLGFSNPVLFVERDVWKHRRFQLRGAVQAELPLGSSEDGLASNHFEALPYVSLSTSAGGLQIHGQVGIAIGLEGGSHSHEGSDHSHGQDTELLVNPHASQEVLTRVAVMTALWDGVFMPGIHFNGRHSVHGSSVNDVISVNAVGLLKLSKQMAIVAQIELPFHDNPRFDWRAGLGFDVKL